MRSFTDEGLVLKRFNYADSDRMLTLFTRDHGKISATAKGIRRLTSRKAPHLELFTHSRLYIISANFPLVTEASTLANFSNLKLDLTLTRSGFHLLEVLDKLLPEAEPLPRIFNSAIDTLNALNNLTAKTLDHRHLYLSQFYKHLLTYLGFGLPNKTTPTSLYAYLETVLDQKLTSAKSYL